MPGFQRVESTRADTTSASTWHFTRPTTAGPSSMAPLAARLAPASGFNFGNIAISAGRPARITGTDEYARYERSQQELQSFLAAAPYPLVDHVPSTRLGFFDAVYEPPDFNITINVRFRFLDWTLPADDPPDARWDTSLKEKSKEKWKQCFLTDVSSTWTHAKLLLFCTREWWEWLTARVVVRFVEDENRPHYVAEVLKVPKGRSSTSRVVPPVLGRSRRPGRMDLTSTDVEPMKRSDVEVRQRADVHEAGHALGLGDEYSAASGLPAHRFLVQEEFGHDVPVGHDKRIMSDGERIDPEHGVTFLEAMKKATSSKGIDMTHAWALLPPHAPKHIPYAPERITDLPVREPPSPTAGERPPSGREQELA